MITTASRSALDAELDLARSPCQIANELCCSRALGRELSETFSAVCVMRGPARGGDCGRRAGRWATGVGAVREPRAALSFEAAAPSCRELVLSPEGLGSGFSPTVCGTSRSRTKGGVFCANVLGLCGSCFVDSIG